MVGHSRDDQFELNTLKISQDTKQTVRKPYVWEKPNPRLYDYHYEVGGLYYQPMIKYICGRKDGERKTVEVPDRILSNFDRRAYELKKSDVELEEFLTESYRRKMKDINSKYVHVENEKVRRSKRNSELNMIRGAATTRDNYLCKLQLYYTGQAAHRDKEEEDLTLAGRNDDDFYSPGFQRVVLKRSSRVAREQQKRVSQVLEEKYDQENKEVNNSKFETQLQFLNSSIGKLVERAKDIKEKTREDLSEETLPPSTFMIALSDVKRRIDTKRKEIESVKMHPNEMNVTYSGIPINEVGLNERCYLKSNQFKPRKLPDFDLGYDTVDRIL
eukprot:TRINITY_DN11181_c0_g1_i3.p1 TRINITY_DN11181_c0_g1~~TRINITY_DN11181_c0_g1_i3.p1  ORF type:complete len:337 (-),score=92.17 TRINITY_DN11181_c0_g1_i3:106-1092(-)